MAIALLLIVSSGLAIYSRHLGKAFDPAREVESLRGENRRDDSLDMTRFFIESGDGDVERLKDLEKGLEYTLPEKVKSFLWDGVIKGEVYDSYSGLGAISTDLCILGDLRDLGIQSWKYITLIAKTLIGLSCSYPLPGLGYLPQGLQTAITP